QVPLVAAVRVHDEDVRPRALAQAQEGDLPSARRPDRISVRYSVPRQLPQSAAVGIDQEELVVAGTGPVTQAPAAPHLQRKDELPPVGRPGSAVVACEASCQA